MLRTALTKKLDIKIPIVSAPMLPFAGGELAAAVSDAGGFGTIALDPKDSVEKIETEIALARKGNAQRKFGLGLTIWALEGRPELLDIAIAQKPTAICLSFGDIAPYAKQILKENILLISQVQDLASAKNAEKQGADILVAQGTEAGGHTGSVGTLPLLQIVLDKVSCPVVAAGGIGSGRGLAAVLAAGAVGAWIGTPFLLAKEARITHAARDRILNAKETQTVHTHLFDKLQNIPWPEQFPGRALQNTLTDKWHGKESEAAKNPEVLKEFQTARANQNFDITYIYAGQIVGLLDKLSTADDIIKKIAEDCEKLLQQNCFNLVK